MLIAKILFSLILFTAIPAKIKKIGAAIAGLFTQMFSLFNRLRPAEDVLAKLKNNTPPMTRCDYDAVFYRVFCVTLLAIAFTFTVILTNVFIDIDGLLAKKHNARLSENIINDEFTSETTENDDLSYGENEDSYRTKRSIETQSFLFHIKNPKIKNILANRLSTLLEELEAEESQGDHKAKEKPNKDPPTDAPVADAAKLAEDKKTKLQKDEDMLHLTMHNILLQGIIGHMDLNDVYKRVHSLMKSFYKDGVNSKPAGSLRSRPDTISTTSDVTTEKVKSPPKRIEEKFFEELLNCNTLQNEIENANQLDKINEDKVPNIMIKTVIDIKSLGNEKSKENDTKYSKDNIKGVVELIYNGNTITFTRQDLDNIPTPQKKQTANIEKLKPIKLKKVINETRKAIDGNDFNKIPKSYFNKFLEEYFKRFPQNKEISTEIKENYETKRLKRHIKIRYDTEKASKEKPEEIKKEDDELFVEIETHFDSKGLKGEKKKKLVRRLIEKIQKAIHSDMDSKVVGKENKHKTHKKIHFKKRLQDPLEHKNRILMNKYSSLPMNPVIHRQLNPISKTIPMQESSPFIGSKSGEEWKKPCPGPTFLTATKSINSAEMSEVDIDYTKVLDVNGIPQRLQKPLNTELSEETLNTNSYYDLGKMKFFIKDIDGSGFSVGFNQYTDEPPDADTMKLFTGLENVIKTYHQSYDPADPIVEPNVNNNGEEKNQEAPPNNDHVIARRSINKHDYHSNEYKIIFDDNFLPFNDYSDIFETKKSRTNKESGDINNGMPLIVDENIFEKNLKPAEIFGLANLLDRKKRSMKIKKISNLKSKIKLNRFLNTKAMSSKRIFLNNKKRNKRQINKIRIIATDLPHMSKHSDENVFVVSDENIFADRAIVKELETSEIDHEKQEETEEPYQTEDTGPATYITKIFDSRSRHNPLMSKYPHIFMEEISRSREEYIPDNSLLFGKIPGFSKMAQTYGAEKLEQKLPEEQISSAPVPNATESPKLQKISDIANILSQQPTKTNYKVTMKIIPKNMTGLNSGFKEIHTSINKRFNKNGLLYSSLVNVSEISKVIKLNRSKSSFQGLDPQLAKRMREQQGKMQFLLKEHAKHINEQLNRLNEEKLNLESILEEENNDTDTLSGHLDYDDFETGNPPNPVNGQEEEHNEAEQQTTTEIREVTQEQSTIRTTRPTTPPTPPHPPAVLYEKIKKTIMNTIEKNGNLTDQILKKIDTNTELLQMFLMKLTDKIQAPKPKAPEENKEDKEMKYVTAFPQDWVKQGMQFNQNMVIRKNDSHISIPFVYAYQQPLIPHQRDSPVANLIYHGHIHTNTIQNKDNSAEKENVKTVHKIPETNNQSRFFIDELENDYKVIQVGDVKKNPNYNMVNGTRARS